MQLASLADPSLVFPLVPGGDSVTVLRGFAHRILESAAPELGGEEELFQALWEREQLGSTGIGSGVAIPHCKLRGIDRVLLAIGHSRQPIDFGAVDGAPVRLFFIVVSPDSEPAAHLQCLAAISRWVQQSGGIDGLLGIADSKELFDAVVGGG